LGIDTPEQSKSGLSVDTVRPNSILGERHMGQKTIRLNGKKRKVSVPDDSQQLLYVLREQLDQQGPKFG
jgi:hypothetical protein